MAEYIDKKQTVNRIASCYCMDCEHSNGILCRVCAHQDDMDLIDEMPAADIQAVNIKYPFNVKKMTVEDHSFYVVESNILKGCVAQGDTLCGALMLFSELENEWLETAQKHNIPIPEEGVLS